MQCRCRKKEKLRLVALSLASLVVVFSLLSLLRSRRCEDRRPIIGVLSVERPKNRSGSYLPASYVKFIESAGGRVVPIFCNSSLDTLKSLFSSINGVLIPGGGRSLFFSRFARVGRAVVEMAMEAHDAGDYFPVWGTCLGFELLATIIGGGGVRSQTCTENLSLPLNLTSAAQTSRLFSLFPSTALDWVSREPLTANYHAHSITMETFNSNPKLTEFFSVLSTNMDKNGVEFVSTVEGKQYPVYGVQWHPEKNGFEWGEGQATNHSEHAVAIMQYTTNFFIQEACKSGHRFKSSGAEQRALISSYSQFLRRGKFFSQVYIF